MSNARKITAEKLARLYGTHAPRCQLDCGGSFVCETCGERHGWCLHARDWNRRQCETCATKEFKPWQCHARPAAKAGKACGHWNDKPLRYHGQTVCRACGCTKKASDERKAKAESIRKDAR